MGSLIDALASVDAFDANPDKVIAWNLDRGSALARLREILNRPELLHQRGLNACGPAVFFRVWLARDPAAVAVFACNLLKFGSANIGSLVVAAGHSLLNQNYSQIRASFDANAGHQVTPESADWMLLSALRDSENIFLDYLGEPSTVGDMAAGVTLPSTVQGWLASTNVYSLVVNETNLVFAADKNHLLGLMPTANLDVVLMVNSAAASGIAVSPISPGWSPPPGAAFSIPNHYISMTGRFSESSDRLWVHMNFWSWGENQAGWQGSDLLFSDYFGTVTASI